VKLARVETWPTAITCGAAATVIAYAATRVVERVFFPEPNPAMLIWSEQSPFVWRVAMALYLGGAGAFGGHALAMRSQRRAARAALVATAAAVVGIVVQGALWP
jgi:hypothetical protein